MADLNPRLPIQVRKATRADIDNIVRINVDAFRPGIMTQLMYPTGMSDDAKSKYRAGVTKLIEEDEANEIDNSKPKPKEAFIVVAETVPGELQTSPEVIAYASWGIWREPRKEEEWNVVEPVSAYTAEGANDDFMEAFMGGIHTLRRRNMKGDPGICLRSLACTPTRGRSGAGSALLRFGTELADTEGLPIWLEASPQGYPLYRRFGFEAVDVMDLPLTEKWGAVRSPDDDWGVNSAVERFGVPPEGVNRSAGMRRLPVKK